MAVQIARTEDGLLHVDVEALELVLDKVGAHPLAVVAVSGPLQKGKSSIVNDLLRLLAAPEDRSHENDWKSSADQPNEILMWPEPLMSIHNGQSTAILLMSVHGNLDGTITTMDNALIFAFGCLIASVTIYHVDNGFSEAMLQVLQTIIASAKAVSHQGDCCPFAKLLFAINEWQLPGDYAHGSHDDRSRQSVRNFKKDKLNVLTGIMPEGRVVRKEILSSFQEVGCFLMRHFRAEVVHALDVVQHHDLAGWIFREGRSIRKTVNSKEVTGTELKGLVQEWAGSLVTSKIPAFWTDVEAPGELSNAVALSVALKFFRTEMANAVNGPKTLKDEQLGKAHELKKREALAMFERLTTSQQEAVLRRYKAMLEVEFDEFCGTFLHLKTARQQHPRPPLPGPVHVQMEHPGHADVLGSKKSSGSWRAICYFVVFFHIVVVAIVILWMTYRRYSKNAAT